MKHLNSAKLLWELAGQCRAEVQMLPTEQGGYFSTLARAFFTAFPCAEGIREMEAGTVEIVNHKAEVTIHPSCPIFIVLSSPFLQGTF